MQKSSAFQMSGMGTGMFFLIESRRNSPHSVHLLGDTVGEDCPLVSQLHQKYFNNRYQRPLKVALPMQKQES